MKITVITGSPHKNGTSALLADKFIEGAKVNFTVFFRYNTKIMLIYYKVKIDRLSEIIVKTYQINK